MASEHDNQDHKHGSMDISQQQATFHGFISFATWVVILSLLALIFMALTNA